MTIYSSLVRNFKKILRFRGKNNICVVFDIDGTIIVEGVYAPTNNSQIVMDVYKFLIHLQQINIPIFIVTARPESKQNRLGTIKMLHDLGIMYEYLYMWNRNIFEDHIIFKEKAREDINIQGYNIVMSLGDNWWDYGKFGGLGVHIYNDGEKIEYYPE
jgi:predicted secreted acid phosphatase